MGADTGAGSETELRIAVVGAGFGGIAAGVMLT